MTTYELIEIWLCAAAGAAVVYYPLFGGVWS